MKLSKLQEKIVNASEPYIAVYAAAAAGKTAVLTERVRKMLRDGINPSDIACITFTNLAAQEMRERLANDYKNGIYIGTIHGLANYFLLSNGIDTSDLIESEQFDKFFERIEENPSCIKHIKHILLDEAQDTSPDEYKFIFDMILPETFFIVGDLRQCQPAGTKVLLANKEEKNIEDIEIGDTVICYDKAHGHVFGGSTKNALNMKVLNKSSRILKDEKLIKVYTVDGHSSIYTYNHRTITNLCRFDEYNYLTYLMCDKNNRFRVGVSQFKNTNNGPWRAKMLAEGCEKIWILNSFKTNKEARVLEDKISYQYQIPQVTFQLDKTTYTQEDIDFIYSELDTYNSAIKCLKDFNRDINFPFAQRDDNNHYASNAFNETYACNILPNNMKMLIYDSSVKHRKKAVDIDHIEYINDDNIKVYSLDIEKYHTYVADGIFTHNSIYSFKGCDPDLFDNLMADPSVTVYSLNENYRNGDNILRYAKRILQKSFMTDDSIAMRHGGTVWEGDATFDNLKGWIQRKGEFRDWAVLCTTNATIAELQYKLEKAGIPTVTFRQGEVDKSKLEELMNSNAVKVLTYWSAKGLEFPYVAAWEPKNWGGYETYRVNYVGATRAKDILLWMEGVKKKKKDKWF